MATFKGWGTDRTIAALLFEEGYRFEFFRAVQLLEMMHPSATAVGRLAEPEKEAVRFKSKVDTSFPPTEIDHIAPGRPGDPDEVTVAFMGLAGALGPLPAPYTQLIIDRCLRHDPAFRDFLDIFNHRLVSLWYRARLNDRIGLENRPADETKFSRYLFSLIGLGLPGLRQRMDVQDWSLLPYAGILAQRPRSMKGLEIILADYFGVEVRGRSFVGQWLDLDEDQWTRIGRSGQNAELGRTLTLGQRVWSQTSAFEIRIGPLHLETFLNFLPIGRSFLPLCQLLRLHADLELDYRITLLLKAREAPGLMLGGSNASRLGWTSWIKTGNLDVDYLAVSIYLTGAEAARQREHMGGACSTVDAP